MEKVVLTQAGYQKLLDELQYLKTTKRVEVANELDLARSHGDLRENAQYDAAKEAKSHLEGRIAMLEERLGNAKVVDIDQLDHSKAYLGSSLKIKNLNTEDEFTYHLVSQDEADFDTGKISVNSPIGKGLLGKEVGEVAEIKAPAGLIKLKVLNISYEE